MVVIGFEQPRYTVGESDGQVNIAVTTMSGRLDRPVMVTVVTMEDIALSKTNKHLYNYYYVRDLQ